MIDIGSDAPSALPNTRNDAVLVVAMVHGLIGQCMLANEIEFDRFIRGSRKEAGFGEQFDLQRQQIAEDTGTW